MNINVVFSPFVVALIISFVMTPFAIFFAKRAGLIDDPSKNKHPKVIHKVATPRGGVISIFFAILIATLLFFPFDNHIRGILAGAFILTILGLFDDKYNLNPYLRIFFQILAALMPIVAGIGIAYLNNPIQGGVIDLSHPRIIFEFLGTHSIWVLSDLFALVWIVALMNFLNMGAKGLPGQLPGVVAIAAITIALLSLKFSTDTTEWSVTTLAMIVAGSYLGFLYWNMYPQKIMPGFGGSTMAGYLLAVLSILTTTKVGTLFIVLSVPVIDTTFRIIMRIKDGHSPVWGDRGHLHHKLLDIGWSQKKVSYFYWLVTALLGAIAIGVGSTNKLYTIIAAAVLITFVLWITTQLKQQKT